MARLWALGSLSLLVVVVRLVAGLVMGLMIAALSACSSNSVRQPSVTPAQLSSNPDPELKGTELVWGGVGIGMGFRWLASCS